MFRKGFILTCLLSFSVYSFSQNLRGYLINKKDKKPISYAIVQLVEAGQWTIATEDGYFSFTDIKESQVTLFIRHLGMQEFSQTFQTLLPTDAPLKIELTPQSYDMQEVTVVAKKGQGTTSSTSFINKEAIDHVQPTTLADIMQLLPGNLIENPDLQTKQNINIREIGDETNSAMGMGIYIDGTPITNDGNYQTYTTTKLTSASTSINGTTGSTVGEGIDMRQFSTDNIESIEVVKGIPSVEYGNLTSGLLVVNTKSGRTPIELKLKSTPLIKQAYLGKGLSLNNGNSFNINIDYTQSYKDIRTKYTSFNRITGQITYSGKFINSASPLSIKTGLSFFQTTDKAKTDPDALVAEELIKESETGVRLNLNSQWMLNKPFITNLEGKFSVSINNQEYYSKAYRSSGIEMISLAQTAGENEGIYLPSESLTELTIKGLPVNVFANLKASKHFSFGTNSTNNILYGFEYNLTGNYGEGRIYDITNPPTVSRNTTRPRSYKDIPPMQYYSVFIEDKHKQQIGNTALTIQAGIRLNNFQPTKLVQSDVGFRAEPRLNINYQLYQSQTSFIKLIQLHGGLGLNYKAPPILYLYPDKAYIDLVSLDHYTGNSETNLAYFTTIIIDTKNNKLKPSKNFKKEFGLEIKLGSVKGDITAYYENMTDGFGMSTKYQFVDYRIYDDSSVKDNEKPDITTLPYDTNTYIVAYSYPVNNKQTQKYGIEYSFDFGRLDAIATRLTMNGAWMRTHRIFSTINYDYLPTSDEEGQYEEIGVYPAGEGNVKERLNTTFRFITHSTKLRLIFTTTVQTTWYDKTYYTYYNESPMYLYSRDKDYIEFTQEMRSSTDYRNYVNETGTYYYLKEIMPPLFLFNFKLSKEIYERAKLSFYANNFFNYRPMYQYKRSLTYVRRNPEIYFGAELTVKL